MSQDANLLVQILTPFKNNKLLKILGVVAIILGVVHFSLIIWRSFFQHLLFG